MSTPKHTPTPWYIDPDAPEGAVICATRSKYVVLDGDDSAWEPEIKHANAARAVACVNACEGIDDPAAEIARLREIERVARRFLDVLWSTEPANTHARSEALFRAAGDLSRALTPKEP